MDFAWAISALKAGLKVTRKHWKNNQFLWLKPAVHVEADWCHDPVLKRLTEQQDGVPATPTISVADKDVDGTWIITTGWIPQQYDLFAEDWMVYFGEGHEKQTPEEIEAYKKLALDRMPGGSFWQQMLELRTLKAQQQEKAEIDKLPKAGSMENCEILSNAINQLLESIGVMPHLTVTLVPGPEDKEFTIAIRTDSENGAANYPIHVDGDMQISSQDSIACHVVNPDGIIKTNIGSPVKSTKTVAGGYEVEDMQSNLGKED